MWSSVDFLGYTKAELACSTVAWVKRAEAGLTDSPSPRQPGLPGSRDEPASGMGAKHGLQLLHL